MQRREFLKTALCSGAALALPAWAARPRASAAEVPVVIVGGGIAGLSAARYLANHGVDDFLVLDAREEIGGRILDLPLHPGAIAEGGAGWVGPTQTAILDLMLELGIATFPTYDTGADLFAVGKHVVEPDSSSSAEIDAALNAADELSLQVPLEAPWSAQNAQALDGASLDAWLRDSGFSATVRLAFDKITWATLGALARDVSLLYFLFYIRSSGGVAQRIGVTGAGQGLRVEGGPQSIPKRIARDLGARLVTGDPVRAIEHGPGEVIVHSRRMTVRARHAIVAMMPRDIARIRFSPALSTQRRQLMLRWPAAKVFKANVVYPEPFWRARGLSGQVSGLGTIYSVFDNSPKTGEAGVLEAFSQSGMLPQDPAERVRFIVSTLAGFFGPDAWRFAGYVEKDWADERWISGCVSPLQPGFLTTYGPALREPVGRIHWASAETAEVWNGKMDGAVRAGKSAAAAVLAQM